MKNLQKEVADRYDAAGKAAKAYARARLLLGHFEKVDEYIPKEGEVLDYGCGVGQLALLLSMASPRRKVYGYDISDARIDAARLAAQGLENVSFFSDVSQVPDIEWDAVVFFDFLHYLGLREQEELVANFALKTRPEGVVFIRDIHKSGGMRYAISRLHEKIMVGTGITPTDERNVWFRDLNELAELLRRMSFSVKIIAPPALHPYADYTLVAKKKREKF